MNKCDKNGYSYSIITGYKLIYVLRKRSGVDSLEYTYCHVVEGNSIYWKQIQ